MEQRAYKRLLAQLGGLTPEQAVEVSARLHEQQAQQSTCRLVEQRLREQGTCPHCGVERIVKLGSSGGTQRYRCNVCRRTFTALTGTPFSRLREKDKLLANAVHDAVTPQQFFFHGATQLLCQRITAT